MKIKYGTDWTRWALNDWDIGTFDVSITLCNVELFEIAFRRMDWSFVFSLFGFYVEIAL